MERQAADPTLYYNASMSPRFSCYARLCEVTTVTHYTTQWLSQGKQRRKSDFLNTDCFLKCWQLIKFMGTGTCFILTMVYAYSMYANNVPIYLKKNNKTVAKWSEPVIGICCWLLFFRKLAGPTAVWMKYSTMTNVRYEHRIACSWILNQLG